MVLPRVVDVVKRRVNVHLLPGILSPSQTHLSIS